LIQALVKYGGEQFEDIIQGKRGGSVFLLHGAPGVGKTLTAEAVAEVLHKPLYYVTMGELGTDPETMEKRIGEILNLCSGWDALTLIDEADVFLEKRATSDVLRNAMVCVMLRLLEYHDGILFLTTNRVTEFDPAFESRVTVALKYDHLSESARQQVWKNLTRGLRCGVKPLDYTALGAYVLNGRQIKNAVRLGVALALDQKLELSQELLQETIEITNLGRYEMKTADKY
jgi:SpoVK/Ycf46/Vps4 family AAA+-type ATPase